VNRPRAGVPAGALVFALARLRDVTVQACFVEGAVSNVGPEAVGAWIELVRELRPRAVQIYTIDRPPAGADVHPASPARLESIARALGARAGTEVRVYA
jgi:wyosine [tRNA(Phe)-imidazoG37] synthetase (radical SAM superfamily)